MFVCAGESEQFDFAVPIGIGLLDAAIVLTRLCLEKNPEKIVFVGSAGSYGAVNLLEIVESSRAVNIESSFLNAGSYSPIEHYVSCETLPASLIVNSSNYITTDKSLSPQYLERNIQIENMEFYAVLKVAKKFGIPAKGIFCVTNYCDANAHVDFLANHEESKRLLAHYINPTKEKHV